MWNSDSCYYVRSPSFRQTMPTVGVNADRSIFTWQIQFRVLHHISVTLNIHTSSKRVQPKMFSLCMFHSRLLQNLQTCDDDTN